MITYTIGNLLDAHTDALVSTVNEVGVMGKGVALQFKGAFPDAAREYMDAAKRRDVRVGRVLVTATHALEGTKYCESSLSAVRNALNSWPGGAAVGRRKQQLFDDRMINFALERVGEGIHSGQPQLPLC